MSRLYDWLVDFTWSHPLTVVGVVLCAILYARVMLAGPREG